MGLFDRIKTAIASKPADPADVVATAPKVPPATAGSANDTLGAIVSYLVESSQNQLRATEIDTGVDIFEYGYVDSLRVTKLFEFIEERWGVVVPEVEIVGRLNNLKALAEFIDSQKQV